MSEYVGRVRFLVFLFFTLLSSGAAAYSDLLYDCSFSGINGDRTTRGFYVENYPSNSLGGVVLGLGSSGNSGLHSITLQARLSTYDGTLIGSVSRDLNLTGTNTQFDFDFANAPVTPGATVAFIIEVTSDPTALGYAFYDVGISENCVDVTQTNGTSPPLDTVRRATIGLSLYGISDQSPPPSTYSVGGTVSGLTGTGLALQNNGADTLAVAADGPFAFVTELTDLSDYLVTVSTQPTGQTCSVTNGSGTIDGADIADVGVTCEDDVEPPVVPSTPATPVPTLANWALITLAVLLGMLVIANRRRLF